MKPAAMLHQMCHAVFAETDVKAVCKARGFPPPAVSSRGVLETLFLSQQGLSQSFDSLDRDEIALLHLLKTAGAVDVAFFSRIYGGENARGTFSQRFQNTFTRVKQRLVRQGLLLLSEATQFAWHKKTKIERWRFALPVEFHPHLPPLIASPRSLEGDGTWKANVVRDQIKADLGHSSKKPTDCVFQIQDGELRVHGEPFNTKTMADWQQSGWQQAVAGDKKSRPKDSYSKSPDEAVLCILSDLPNGHWADAEQLADPFRIFSGKKTDAATVCDAGVEWGLLAKRRADGKTWYRLAPPRPVTKPDQYLSVDGKDGDIAIDLPAVPFDALEQIVAISNQRIKAGKTNGNKLSITPNIVKLGRAGDDVLAADPVQWLVEHTQPFAEAYVVLGERRGKTILHENVCVAQVGDLSLKVAIEKALGEKLVSFKNEFIAFPSDSLDEVRRVVKKSGHVVKEVSTK